MLDCVWHKNVWKNVWLYMTCVKHWTMLWKVCGLKEDSHIQQRCMVDWITPFSTVNQLSVPSYTFPISDCCAPKLSYGTENATIFIYLLVRFMVSFLFFKMRLKTTFFMEDYSANILPMMSVGMHIINRNLFRIFNNNLIYNFNNIVISKFINQENNTKKANKR